MTRADLAAIYAACEVERTYLAAAVDYARAVWRDHRAHRAYSVGYGSIHDYLNGEVEKRRATAALECAALAAGWLL